jgi:DNA mismatch endonuclease, patch repair protein
VKLKRMADNLSPAQRSYCMSRIRNKDTDLEALVRSVLFRRGWRFRKHVASLPGKPDIVFSRWRVAVFIDGDFWHGYRFSQWNGTLSEFWRIKIEKNRNRDRNNFQRLRTLGWRVIRIGQHEIKSDLDACIERIEKELS